MVGPDTLLRTGVIPSELSLTHNIRRLQVSHHLHLGFLPELKELILDYVPSFGAEFGQLAPNLETMTIQYGQGRARTQCVLPCLRELVLYGPEYYIASGVEAPDLGVLRLETLEAQRPSSLRTFQEALDDPSYHLSPSRIHINCSFHAMIILQLLQLSPNLEHLAISIYSQNDRWEALFDELMRRRESPQDAGHLGWQLCERLIVVHISFKRPSLRVERAQKCGMNLLENRPIMHQISFDWSDGLSIVIKGKEQ